MININIILFIGICIVTTLLLYISFVQFTRANKAENIANSLADKFVEIQNMLTEASNLLNQNPRLKTAFESDDEVGDFFKLLQEVGEKLKDTVENSDNA